MKKSFFLGSVCLIIILSALFLSQNFKSESSKLISPVPHSKVLGVNLWFPKQVFQKEADEPKITAKSALFIETKTGEVLYSKDANKKLPIASLVKVMTALIALDHRGMDDKFIVSKQASEMEADKMLLIAGEKLTLKELLFGIFLISANDAAEVLAQGTTGQRDEFIKLMNERGKQLGMNDTYFANPTGLDEDSNNSYSTAYDLAILTRYLIREHPEVVEISKTPHIYIDRTDEHQDYDMYSGINLLTTYPGVVGFKTGYTPEAGLTLITLARKNGQEVIGVLLGSEYRRDEARELLDYSFKKLGI
ncbi:D-alanyl-D-alanine carboxypeptidase [Candidatus Daviesbacteria bacterium]|nr:D-alanyl-D-alanine carboxypeptidase [Candidatus Daviesbacteria bacterium]